MNINMNLCTQNCTNCTGPTVVDPTRYHIETAILVLMLIYILALNLTGVVVTIGSAELRGCLFSMQLAASYVGDILGAASLIGNDIYFSQRGIIPFCQKGRDKYVFLYFGISLNMMVLIMNTHYRYQRIDSTTKCDQNPVRTRDIVLKNWVPGLLASACVCVVAVLIQEYYGQYYQYLISMGVCVAPLGIAITWNIVLSRKLKIARRSSKYVHRDESVAVLNRATFIINSVIVLHVVFLFGCVTATLCSLYVRHMDVAMGICWLLRLLYFVLFTIEGHVYLSKVKLARDIIKTKLLICCRPNMQISSENNAGFDADEQCPSNL